jgi:hypothetical protein
MKNTRQQPIWRSVVSATALSSLIVGGLGLGVRGIPSAYTATVAPALTAPAATTTTRTIETLGKLPLSFEENCGQTDASVKYLARGEGYSLFLTPTEAVLALKTGEKGEMAKRGKEEGKAETKIETENTQSANVRPKSVGLIYTPVFRRFAPGSPGARDSFTTTS